MIRDKEQMKPFLTNVYQRTKTEALENVKPESLLLPEKSDMFSREEHWLKSHGP